MQKKTGNKLHTWEAALLLAVQLLIAPTAAARAARSSLTRFGTCSISAAGVPGRMD